MKVLLIKRIICTVWTIDCEFHDDNTVTINKYSSSIQDGYDYEFILPQGEIVEDINRTAIAVSVRGKELKVRNPKFIFDYKEG